MSELGNLIREIQGIKRRMAQASRHGVITDVKDGKVRMSMGYRDDGTEHKGPWLYPGQHNGIMRVDVPFRKGQNVTIDMPTGDPRQARVMPYGPNKENPRPIHASETASTSQHPHFDKDGKEEKDKDKPGFQRTESSTERTTEMDKISKSTQTKTNQTREIIDKVGGKAKSFIDQTFGGLQRKLEDGKGAVSELMHTAKEVLHKVGDKSSHSHTAEGFLREVGGSKLQHLADKVLHQVGGGSKSLLDGAKHLFEMGGHTAETSAGGTKFGGGQVSHDGKDIGSSHTHNVLGPFGKLLTTVPLALPSGGGGGGDGGGGGGDPGEPPAEEVNWDMVPFAWGGFRDDGAVITPYGRQSGLTFTRQAGGIILATFTEPTPYGDSEYRVQVNQEGPIKVRVPGKTPQSFVILPDGTDPYLAWFLIMP